MVLSIVNCIGVPGVLILSRTYEVTQSRKSALLQSQSILRDQEEI